MRVKLVEFDSPEWEGGVFAWKNFVEYWLVGTHFGRFYAGEACRGGFKIGRGM